MPHRCRVDPTWSTDSRGSCVCLRPPFDRTALDMTCLASSYFRLLRDAFRSEVTARDNGSECVFSQVQKSEINTIAVHQLAKVRRLTKKKQRNSIWVVNNTTKRHHATFLLLSPSMFEWVEKGKSNSIKRRHTTINALISNSNRYKYYWASWGWGGTGVWSFVARFFFLLAMSKVQTYGPCLAIWITLYNIVFGFPAIYNIWVHYRRLIVWQYRHWFRKE